MFRDLYLRANPRKFHRGGAIAFRGLLLISVFIAIATLGLTQPGDQPPEWFARPYLLPKDVFDLPAFDRFRSGGKLNVDEAEAYIESLSDADLPAAQRLFDIFAWRAFVALNWPALANGNPDPSKGFNTIAENTPLVWQFWEPTANVFLPNGQTPVWSPSPGQPLDHFKAGWSQNAPVNQGLQAFSGPLVDQNGHWVHYVSYMNRVEFDYLTTGKELYNLEGQEKFLRSNKIEFPQGNDSEYGSIEIKLAWKVLTPSEAASNRFLVKRLPIVEYHPAFAPAPPAHLSGKTSDNGSSTTKVETVGLIGMHISMRTRSSPQWIWATFEQIDNTRLDYHSGDRKHPLPPHPSLANPDNPDALVEANVLPPYNADAPPGAAPSDWDERKPMSPVEVLRLVPPPQGTERINILAQTFLSEKDSVLRYYELNGTQWPKHPNAPAVPGGMPNGMGSAPDSIIRKMPGEVVPVYLTNSTMETYFQKGFQTAAPLEQDDHTGLIFDTTMVFGTESCAGCHYSAGACIEFRRDPATHKLLTDQNGNKIPMFGQNGNGGYGGNANFSWLLQLEAKMKNPKP
jgi:hypothetical protein